MQREAACGAGVGGELDSGAGEEGVRVQVRFCGGLGQEGFELVLRGLGREAVGRGGVLHGRVDCAGGGHGEGFVGFWSRVEGVCFVLCCCMECWFKRGKSKFNAGEILGEEELCSE